MTTKAEKRVKALARRDDLRKSRKAEKVKKWAEWLQFCEDNPSPKLLHIGRVRYRTGKQILAGHLPARTLARFGVELGSGMTIEGIDAMKNTIARQHAAVIQRNNQITSALLAEHKERNTKLELKLIDA